MCGGFGYGPYGGVDDVWGSVISGVVSLLFLAGLIVLVIWAIRAFTRPPAGADTAMEVLRRRLAAGEISQEDFDKTRRLLQS
jgi:putative membrane protein